MFSLFSIEFWIIFAIICILGELLTGGFFLLSIGIGACSGAISHYFNFNIESQIIIFIIVSITCILLSRPLSKKLNNKTPKKKTNTERLIGLKGEVLEKIEPNTHGIIKIKGEQWRASSKEKLKPGDNVEIIAIEGVKLVVKKIN